jgi:hypothetical protein
LTEAAHDYELTVRGFTAPLLQPFREGVLRPFSMASPDIATDSGFYGTCNYGSLRSQRIHVTAGPKEPSAVGGSGTLGCGMARHTVKSNRSSDPIEAFKDLHKTRRLALEGFE